MIKRRSFAVLAALCALVTGIVVATGPGAQASVDSNLPAGAAACKGWGGVANNFVGFGTGGLFAAIIGEPELGTPYLDGKTVRVDGSVPFYSWGSCSSQIELQLQSNVCGSFGCEWRNLDTDLEFLWAHADVARVSAHLNGKCRSGKHSYRMAMKSFGPVSEAERGNPGIIGASTEFESDQGAKVTFSC